MCFVSSGVSFERFRLLPVSGRLCAGPPECWASGRSHLRRCFAPLSPSATRASSRGTKRALQNQPNAEKIGLGPSISKVSRITGKVQYLLAASLGFLIVQRYTFPFPGFI